LDNAVEPMLLSQCCWANAVKPMLLETLTTKAVQNLCDHVPAHHLSNNSLAKVHLSDVSP
jgi:hypothetical protein